MAICVSWWSQACLDGFSRLTWPSSDFFPHRLSHFLCCIVNSLLTACYFYSFLLTSCGFFPRTCYVPLVPLQWGGQNPVPSLPSPVLLLNCVSFGEIPCSVQTLVIWLVICPLPLLDAVAYWLPCLIWKTEENYLGPWILVPWPYLK